MPTRQCIISTCPNPAMPGASRCSTHRGKRRGPRLHDSVHDQLARQVRANATICALCGKPGTPTDPLEAGHIIPLSRGGVSRPDNYRPEHRSHNRAQGARLRRP